MKLVHNTYQKIDSDNFAITLGKAGVFGTPNEELAKIASTMPQKLTVLVSGGADCEVMTKWMVRAGKDVQAVCYRFMYGNKFVNEHDVTWVSELDTVCPVKVKTIDLKVFWQSRWFWEFVTVYKCTSPQLPIQTYMTMVESMEQFTILPAIHPEPKLLNGITHVQEREKDYGVLRYLGNENCLVSPLRHTPEMIASILASDEFTMFHEFGIQDGRDRKHIQYKEWFDIDIKQRDKYHGFEGSEDIDNMMRKRLHDKMNYSESWIFVPAQEMLDNLLTKATTYSTITHSKLISKDFYKLEKW
jgi:hypothetical protein